MRISVNERDGGAEVVEGSLCDVFDAVFVGEDYGAEGRWELWSRLWRG